MKKWSKKKRWVVAIAASVVLLPAIFFGGMFVISRFNLFQAHEHCMKNTGLTLRMYAGEHSGKFPFHTNGFGDAIVVVLKEFSPDYVGIFTAPGDNGDLLKECIKNGTHMPDERCTRMYVQGFSETNNPEIAIVFDRYPTRGGDHFRRPWGPWLREVSLLDGSMKTISEENWPVFKTKQIELLIAEGMSGDQAETLYKPMPNLK